MVARARDGAADPLRLGVLQLGRRAGRHRVVGAAGASERLGPVRERERSVMRRTRNVRNSDFVEVTVVDNQEKVFSGAFIYGFRNIQNLVMIVKVRVAFEREL